MNGYCLDIEANGFYHWVTKIWVIWLKDLNDPYKKLEIRPFEDPDALEKFKEWNDSYDNPTIAFHYGLGYDMFVMMKILGLQFTVGPDTIDNKPCTYIDTLYLSMYVDPDLQGHGLSAYGNRLGFDKIDYHQIAIDNGTIPKGSDEGEEFMHWHPDMSTYCERDVDLNIKVFWKLWKKFTEFYGECEDGLPKHFKCGQKQFYLMSCQEISGWKFDIDGAKRLRLKIKDMMEEIRSEVEPQLPQRGMKKAEEKDYTMPKKPFKNDGSLAVVMERFIDRHNLTLEEDGKHVLFHGDRYLIKSENMLKARLPMEMGNQSDMKDWFLEMGWKPTFWNFKKDKNGKFERDSRGQLIKTSPKIQEQQQICPNLLAMETGIVKDVVKWLSLRNRLSVLEGWLKNDRLQIDGRLPTSRTGITPTHRQKHSVVVNVPKASPKVLLGKEFRSLFICEEGTEIAAGDASALEGRVEGSYTFKFDNGERASIILDGDEHSNNAKIFYPKETIDFDPNAEDFNKDDIGFKPYRDKSKNARYGLTYGCAPKKLAEILGKPVSEAELLYDAFWDGNPSLKELKAAVENYWNIKGKNKYLPAVDGRILHTRKKSALLNTLFQSCGAIAMDYASCFMDSWLGGIKWGRDSKPYYEYKGHRVVRIGYFHDELEFECDKEIASEVSKMIEIAISKAGKLLELKVPLEGEGQVGERWDLVH